jgi:serine protease Do
MLAPDTRLHNRYQIVEMVGKGGMGEVYKALDPMLDRIIAVKTLSSSLTTDDSFVQRFQHEARTVARLSHPHIVPIYDVGQHQNTPFLVMKFIESGSLADLLKKKQGVLLPTSWSLKILEQIATGLDHAHGRGFVHRDIKPANILLDEEGQAYITDFGLVKAEDVSLTMPGQIMGTPAYMSPEQITGEEVGLLTDVYALGVVAYELLTGQAPFQGTMTSVFDGHVRREPPSMLQLNSALPTAAEAVVYQALAKEPQQRYASPTAFVTALQSAFAQVTDRAATMVAPTSRSATIAQPPDWLISARPTDGAETGLKEAAKPAVPAAPAAPEQSRRTLWLAGGGLMLALCLCGVLTFFAWGVSRDERNRLTPTLVAGNDVIVAPIGTPEVEPVTQTAVMAVAGNGPINDLQAVRRATIQIEAQGSFVDPQFGLQLNSAGRGSGFIIDPSGIAVTNNHVVTGAALLRVYVDGETRPRNARVLGVSECSDLAVIQIEGDDFPFLEWYDGAINVGLDIYAAGFPLGDPEYTLTRGVISKAQASGITNWAALDWVLEHDATINPGSSGGPLVTPQGKLVGVNYSGAAARNQYFAIARDQAVPLIAQLRGGQSVHAIGVNGVAVSDGQGLSGIWVSSLKSGSPADRAGVRPGDIITMMEGLLLATDGSMADYCGILRSHHAEDTISIQVLRYDTFEVLEGQLNGRVLEAKFSFAEELNTQVNPDSGTDGYTSYVQIQDDSGALTLQVPAQWSDVDGSPWLEEGQVRGASVIAARNLEQLYNSWTEPGVVFLASRSLTAAFTEETLLDQFVFDECSYDDRYDYQDPVYTGLYDLWYDCGDDKALVVALTVTPADGSFLGIILVQIVTEADLRALDKIFSSFLVDTKRLP